MKLVTRNAELEKEVRLANQQPRFSEKQWRQLTVRLLCHANLLCLIHVCILTGPIKHCQHWNCKFGRIRKESKK